MGSIKLASLQHGSLACLRGVGNLLYANIALCEDIPGDLVPGCKVMLDLGEPELKWLNGLKFIVVTIVGRRIVLDNSKIDKSKQWGSYTNGHLLYQIPIKKPSDEIPVILQSPVVNGFNR
jgi:hypothetical protein